MKRQRSTSKRTKVRVSRDVNEKRHTTKIQSKNGVLKTKKVVQRSRSQIRPRRSFREDEELESQSSPLDKQSRKRVQGRRKDRRRNESRSQTDHHSVESADISSGYSVHHPILGMSLRPKNEEGLAESLLQIDRTFTRGFVRNYHKTWLQKYHPGEQRKEFLIDYVNKTLKEHGRAQIDPSNDHSADSHSASSISIPQENDISKRDDSRSISRRVVRRLPKSTKNTKLVQVVAKKMNYFPRRLPGYLNDGGCLGFNLIGSDIEDYKKPIHRPILKLKAKLAKKPTIPARDVSSREDSCSGSELKYAERKPTRQESMNNVSSKQFKDEFKAYLKQVKGIQPYYFSNLGMVKLHSDKKERKLSSSPQPKTMVNELEKEVRKSKLAKVSRSKNQTKVVAGKFSSSRSKSQPPRAVRPISMVPKLQVESAMVEEVIKRPRGRPGKIEVEQIRKPVKPQLIKTSQEKKVSKVTLLNKSKPSLANTVEQIAANDVVRKDKQLRRRPQLSDSLKVLLQNKKTIAPSKPAKEAKTKPKRNVSLGKPKKILKIKSESRKEDVSQLPNDSPAKIQDTPRSISKGLAKLKESLSKQIYQEDLIHAQNGLSNSKGIDEDTWRASLLGKRKPTTSNLDNSPESPPKRLALENRSTAATNTKAKTAAQQSKRSPEKQISIMKESIKKSAVETVASVKKSAVKQVAEATRSYSPVESVYKLEQVKDGPLSSQTKESLNTRENLNRLFEKIDAQVKTSVDKAKLKLGEYSETRRVGDSLTKRSQDLIHSIKKKSSMKAISLNKDGTSQMDLETILSKPPALLRFDEILKQSSRLNLPFKFQKLFSRFEKLDDLLNFLGMKDTPGFLGVVFKAFFNSMNEEVSIEDIKRMLTVLPGSYTVRWERQNMHDYEMELRIGFPSNAGKTKTGSESILSQEDLKTRRQAFELALFQYIKTSHDAFLKNNQLDYFDCLKVQKYHPRFPLENIEDIPMTPFPSKPVGNSQVSLKNILDIGSEKFLDLVYKVKKSCQKDCFSDSEENKALVGLAYNSDLITLIREKERVNNLRKNFLYEHPFAHKVPELEWLAKILGLYYISKKVTSIFLQNVTAHIAKKCQERMLSSSEAVEMIRYLAKVLPNWLTIVENPEGPILRMNKAVGSGTVLEQLRSHFGVSN